MCDELRQSFALFPRRSEPWIWISKPAESRIKKFVCRRGVPTGALAVKGPAENKLGRAGTRVRYRSEPMVDEGGLADPSPGHDGYHIYLWIRPGRIKESEVLSSTEHF